MLIKKHMGAVEKLQLIEDNILTDLDHIWEVIQRHTGEKTIQLKFQLPQMGDYLDVSIDSLGNVGVTDEHDEGVIYSHKSELTFKRLQCYLGVREKQEDVKNNIMMIVS